MRSRLIVSSLAAASLFAAPVAAQAAVGERASAPATEESEFIGGNFVWLFLAIAAIIAAVVLIDGDDDPVSP